MNSNSKINKTAQAGHKQNEVQEPTPNEGRQIIKCHFISNTHWDREWRFSMQRTRHMLVYTMDMLLDIFEKERDFKSFHLDSQTLPLQDYLEVRPEKTKTVRKLIKQKKLFVGPWFCLPDEFCISGESLIRNLLLGHKIAKRFGYVSKTGYSPFSWGQISQMPQIYKGFGIGFAAFYRGVNTKVAPNSEFMWEGADGTKIVASRLARRPRYNVWYIIQRPAYWNMEDVNCRQVDWNDGQRSFKFVDEKNCELDAHYAHPKFKYYPETIPKSTLQAIDEQNDDWLTPHRFWSCGHDWSCPDIREVRMVRDCNKAMKALKALKAMKVLKETAEVFHSSFEDFQKAVLASVPDNLPITKGEMRYLIASETDLEKCSPLFGGVISARMDLKQDNFTTERELISYAEPLAVFASLLGASYPQGFIDLAYNYLLQNHGHDSIGGCSRGIVGEDMLYRSRQCREICSCVGERAFLDIVGTINMSGFNPKKKEMALVVYNPAAFGRSEVISAEIQIPRVWDCNDFEIVDENRRIQKKQICRTIKQQHYQIVQSPNDTANIFDMTNYDVRIELSDIPSMGYKTFTVKPASKKQETGKTMFAGPYSMENEYIKVEVNSDGTLQITDKATGKVYEQMSYFRDTAEIGNPWQHKDVKDFQPTNKYTTLGEVAHRVVESDGELEASIKTRLEWKLPEGRTKDDKGRKGEQEHLKSVIIENTITLRKGQRWVEIQTDIDNIVEDHLLQVVFPSGIKAKKVAAQGQFDVIERPVKLPKSTVHEEPQAEQPMNSFIDISDGKTGLAILNEGLKAYEATDSEKPELHLTLLRAFPLRICVTTEEMTDYSDVDKSSQCPGKHGFRYAVMPHAGDWAQAELWQAAERFNLAFIAAQTAPTQKGTEPLAKSFLEIDPNNWVYVSATKRSESGKGWVVRLFNPFDKTVCTRIRLNGGLAGQQEVFSPVERIKAEMALPAHKTDKWTVVREVTLEEVPQKQLDVTDDGWCEVELTSRKIVTLQFIP